MLVKLKVFKLSFNNLGKVVHMHLCSYSDIYQHSPAQDFFLAKWHFLQRRVNLIYRSTPSQKMTLMLYTITSTHINQFW